MLEEIMMIRVLKHNGTMPFPEEKRYYVYDFETQKKILKMCKVNI